MGVEKGLVARQKVLDRPAVHLPTTIKGRSE